MIKLSLYLATVLLNTNFSATSTPVVPSDAATPAAVVMAERQIVDLANTERRTQGLGELTVNPLLVRIARQHSREMCDKGYFDHASPIPELRTPMKRYLNTLGYIPKWACVGENLFYCSIADPVRGHHCLMDSPHHRENILDKRFDQIGVGAYIAPDGRFWVTQVFLSQKD
jgi:uncharacterized protein YkwD